MVETEFDTDVMVREAARTLSVLARLTNSVMTDVAATGKISVQTRVFMGDAVAQIMRQVKQEKDDGESISGEGA